MTRREEIRIEGTLRCQKAAKERGGTFIGPYKGWNIKGEWNCGKHTFWTRPACVLSSGTWCKFCADELLVTSMSKIRLKATGFASWEEKMHHEAAKDGDLFIGPLLGHDVLTKWLCKRCNEIFMMTPHAYSRGCRCQPCAKKIIGQKHKALTLAQKGFSSYEEYMQSMATSNKGFFIGPYIEFDDFSYWLCQQGHFFESKPRYVWSGMWCPECCSFGISKAQREIGEFIRGIFGHKESVVLSDTERMPSKAEIDVWVPSTNLAIEFDGLYWHSEAYKKYKNGKSMKKALEAHAEKLKFFMIFEDEWKKKQDLIKKMIEWRIGKFQGKNLNARDLICKKLEKNKEFDWFFEKYHLEGHTQASYAYGLFKDDELISCLSVRTNFKKEFEIARFATNYDYNVRGGAAKLIDKIPLPVISYSNNRLGIGSVYKNNGFQEITESLSPSYFYTDLKTRVWRWQCRRNNDPGILAKYPTEKEQALNGVFSQKIFGDDRPLFRIEDCGHKKWIKREK